MALNIPNTGPAINTLLSGVDTGSSMFSRLMQPVIDRERMKQQQDQFVQNLALQKQTQARAQALMPFMIQQYQDAHRSAASEADMKDMYRNLIRQALSGNDANNTPMPTPGMSPTGQGGQPNAQQGMPVPNMGGVPNSTSGLPQAGAIPVMPPQPQNVAPTTDFGAEQVLREGNPNLVKLDRVAGLVPGIPKPVTRFSNGMIYTTYPSGRMTAQAVNLPGAKTTGEKNVDAKEASKIREQAAALINSGNLVQQGYDLLDTNPDLTGIGSGLVEKFNLSNNPDLGKFTTVTGKLQAELGKYASQRGGIQAVKWAQSVKPSSWKPEDYNYGMFEGIQKNLQDDYDTLNNQYKAVTGQELPLKLPQMARQQGGKGNVTKWKLVGGQLVKE